MTEDAPLLQDTRSVTELLFNLRRKGVRVWADHGKLRYQTTKQTLTSKELEALRLVRDQILDLLQQTTSLEKQARLTARAPNERVPLSFSQQFWYNFWELRERAGTRSLARAARITGPLDLDSLRDSIEVLIARHEALRTTISTEEGATQKIRPPSDYDLEVLDLTSLSPDQRNIESRRLAGEIVNEAIQLNADPLFAARLLKLDRSDHVLVIATEHIISDAASIGIAWRDTFSTYEQLIRRRPQALPKIPIQFPDYAVWQLKTHDSWMERHGAYWTQKLTNATRIHMSMGENASQPPQLKWATLPIRIGEPLRAKLVATSRTQHTSLVMSIFTAFAALILRWCSVPSVVLPFTSAGRHYPEIESTIGYFGTPLFLRIDISESDSFADLLRRTTHEYATAHMHDDSCRMVMRTNGNEAMLNPAFNWIPSDFNFNAEGLGPALQEISSLTITDYKLNITSLDDERNLYSEPRIDLSDSKGGVIGEIGYEPSRFALSTMERIRRNFLLFIETLATDPNIRVKSIALMP